MATKKKLRNHMAKSLKPLDFSLPKRAEIAKIIVRNGGVISAFENDYPALEAVMFKCGSSISVEHDLEGYRTACRLIGPKEEKHFHG